MSALHISSADFDKTLTEAGDKPVLVDFYADWCGPCQMAAPIIEELADEYKDQAIMAKVDVDESRELAGKFGVMSIPTVIVFKKGQPVDTKIGFPGKQGYVEMIDKALKA